MSARSIRLALGAILAVALIGVVFLRDPSDTTSSPGSTPESSSAAPTPALPTPTGPPPTPEEFCATFDALVQAYMTRLNDPEGPAEPLQAAGDAMLTTGLPADASELARQGLVPVVTDLLASITPPPTPDNAALEATRLQEFWAYHDPLCS